MNAPPTDEVILKTDALGRVKTTAARREQLLDEFECSGMSGVQFAAFVGLTYQTFATWAPHRRRRHKTAAPKQLRWMEAVVQQAQAPTAQNQTPLVLPLPGGVRFQIPDAKQMPLAC